MVSIYLDKGFVDEFHQRTDLENEVVEDFYRVFLRKIRGVEITVNLTSVKELKELSKSSRFYADILEINPAVNLNPNWKEDVLNLTEIQDRNPIKLFLLSNTNDCAELERKHGLLFINNKNLIEKWRPVQYNREVSELTPENAQGPYSFGSWEILQNEKHPFQEILILDLFLLEDKANQRLENNIIPLIQVMLKMQKRKPRIIIFTDRLLNSPDGKKYQKLGEAFHRLQSSVADVDICIVHYDKENKTAYQKNTIFLAEHDREIYSNYLKLKSGSGWNLFNEQDEISGSRTSITIQSMFRNDVRNSAKKAFDNLKIYKRQINVGVDKLIPGRFDEDGKLLKCKEFLLFPNSWQSILLQC